MTRGLTTFIFHDITDEPSRFQRETSSYTRSAEFRAQIEWIMQRFTVVSPEELPQLTTGVADRPFPHNAALITFDDAWAGIPQVGLPILHEYGCPAVWFVNMGTILGDPDVAVVAHYEQIVLKRAPDPNRSYTIQSADEHLETLRLRYSDNDAFGQYQGPIASMSDVRESAEVPGVWFGSHLLHHWNLGQIDEGLYRASIQANREALAPFACSLPILATPFGFAGERALRAPRDFGYRVIFVGTCQQERQVSWDDLVVDRVFLPTGEPAMRSWWYATHRKRIFGRYAS